MSDISPQPPPEVPVFNCVVNVSPPDEKGEVLARVANLEGIEGRGKTEREALAQVVAGFKAFVSKHHASGQPIPWLRGDKTLRPGDVQRLIAVHL